MWVHLNIFVLGASLLLSLSLAACGGLDIEQTPLYPLPEMASEEAQPAPIGFHELRFAVPTGTPTISQSPKGPFGLIKCNWPYDLTQTGIRGRGFPSDNFREIFLDTLKGQGYDVTGDPGRFFDEQEDEMRTIYAVGGQIVDVKIDVCAESNFWGIDRGFSGEGSVVVNWSVFDMLNRKKVYNLQTKGYGTLTSPNHEGTALLFENAIESAMHNLGADRPFHDLVFYGTEPEVPLDDNVFDLNEAPITMFDPMESVNIPKTSLFTDDAVDRLESLKKAVVMIEAGRSHGSGFFITGQGHMLSNAHVVGNAVRVRVVTSGKKEKLKAEVLRVDRRRDVALLKLEEIPEDLKIKVLPVRFDEPKVGETVYAIGAPQYKKLQDTVSKGIVSAHRYDRREKQPYIQADVDIYGGNSGGPLLDGQGNLIGMSAKGFLVSADTFGGLNWFIPISEALDKASVGFDE